jgi:hypothetical protein
MGTHENGAQTVVQDGIAHLSSRELGVLIVAWQINFLEAD